MSSNLYDKNEKMNTRIYTGTNEWNSYEGFQRKNELWEDRVGHQGHEKRRADEVACEIGDAPMKPGEVGQVTGWYLPKHFCVECGKNDITSSIGLDGMPRHPSPNLILVTESRPDLDLTVGEYIFCYSCPSCTWNARFGTPNVLVDMDGNPLVSPENTPEGRAHDYIRAMKLRGEVKKPAHEVQLG